MKPLNEKDRNDAIKRAIKIYPHKHGEELAMEIIDHLYRLEHNPNDLIVDVNEISKCEHCHCMTKTIFGLCGKCKGVKQDKGVTK